MSYPYFFTGTLNRSADGTAGTGRYMSDIRVRIVREVPGSRYPILIKNEYNDKHGKGALGWVREEDLLLITYDVEHELDNNVW